MKRTICAALLAAVSTLALAAPPGYQEFSLAENSIRGYFQQKSQVHRAAEDNFRPYGTAGYWVSLGSSPDSKFSLAGGLKIEDHYGFEFGAVFNGDFKNSEISKNEIGHANYTRLGTRQVGESLGLDVLYFKRLSRRMQVAAGVGLYFEDRRTVVRSNTTGLLFTAGKSEGYVPAVSVLAQYQIDPVNFVGVGAHSVRGVVLQLGRRF